MSLKTITILGYSFNCLGLLLGLLSDNWLAVIISSVGLGLNISSSVFLRISHKFLSSKRHDG